MDCSLCDTAALIRATLRTEPLIIAGPCSAESRSQMTETAVALSGLTPAKLFRAGIWKPRTRPGMFEGHGQKALEWLREAAEISGLIPCCETGTSEHVRLAWKAGIKVIWVGARTTACPFTVESIAQAAGRYQMVVLLKNPVCPDLSVWTGAEERFKRSGCRLIIPVHRGFSTHGLRSPYRNAALWALPQKLMIQRPDLPLICDPSHIAGDAHLIHGISRKAAVLGYQGLMAEVHCKPASALTDARQQITPGQFATLLKSLPWTRYGDCSAAEPLQPVRRTLHV